MLCTAEACERDARTNDTNMEQDRVMAKAINFHASRQTDNIELHVEVEECVSVLHMQRCMSATQDQTRGLCRNQRNRTMCVCFQCMLHGWVPWLVHGQNMFAREKYFKHDHDGCGIWVYVFEMRCIKQIR